MPEQSIKKKIEARYPTKVFLAHVNQPENRTFRLSSAQDAEKLEELRGFLKKRMALREAETRAAAQITVSVDPERDYPVLQISAPNAQIETKYWIHPANQTETMAWLIYGFVTNQNWVKQLSGYCVTAEVLSASQQKTYSRILATLRSWTESYAAPEHAISDAIKQAVSRLAKTAPKFSGQILPEDKWREMMPGGVFKRKKPKNLQSNLEACYRIDLYMEQLDDYVVFMCSHSEYESALQQAGEEVFTNLHAGPLNGIIGKIVTSCDNLKNEERKQMENAMDSNGRFKDPGIVNAIRSASALEPDTLFDEVEKELSDFASKKIAYVFIKDLCDRLHQRAEIEYRQAIQKVQDIRSELEPICYADLTARPLDCGWDNPERLCEMSQDAVWEYHSFRGIDYAENRNGFSKAVWLYAPEHDEMIRNGVTTVYEKTIVEGLDSQLLISLKKREMG